MIAFLMAAALATSTTPSLPPAQAGKCGWVRGRFSIWNGSSVRRIWVVGTSRLIAMRDDDDQSPPAVARWVSEGPHMDADHSLWGYFKVCAIDRRVPGHMQHIRIIDSRNLIFQGKPYPPET